MFGQYSQYIFPAYLISTVCLVATALLIRAIYSSRKRQLAALEDEAIDE